jgi:hypothetical protein
MILKKKSVFMKEKPGRNDPCPCGSGKKFKKCCDGKLLGNRYKVSKINSVAKGGGAQVFSSYNKQGDGEQVSGKDIKASVRPSGSKVESIGGIKLPKDGENKGGE